VLGPGSITRVSMSAATRRLRQASPRRVVEVVQAHFRAYVARGREGLAGRSMGKADENRTEDCVLACLLSFSRDSAVT
jgi:hypothetical protein